MQTVQNSKVWICLLLGTILEIVFHVIQTCVIALTLIIFLICLFYNISFISKRVNLTKMSRPVIWEKHGYYIGWLSAKGTKKRKKATSLLFLIVYVGTESYLHNFRFLGYLHTIFFSMKTCCGYSLEVPHRGTSNEYSQCMFLLRNKKTINTFCLKRKLHI